MAALPGANAVTMSVITSRTGMSSRPVKLFMTEVMGSLRSFSTKSR